jgi:outer membrane murein-binding lipoprotein Lpp
MNTARPHQRRERTAVGRLTLVAIAIAVAVVAGCSNGGDNGGGASTTSTQLAPAQQWDPNKAPARTEPTAPTPQSTLSRDAENLDRSDPELVALTAVKIWFTWDTAADTGPNDAAARAAPLLTGAFADSLFATGSNSPGRQWLTWSEQDAVVTPTIRLMPDQGAPQSAGRKYYVYEVIQTARTPEGNQIGTPVTTSAWVICVRNGPSWEVSQLAQR